MRGSDLAEGSLLKNKGPNIRLSSETSVWFLWEWLITCWREEEEGRRGREGFKEER